MVRLFPKPITSDADLERVFGLIKELREHLTFQDYVRLYQASKERDGYTLVGIFENRECLAVMGYRILYDFVHGKHLYVDDLVVTAAKRSEGLGARLLGYAEEVSVQQNCAALRLCTGVQNTRAKSFYERNGWEMRSVAYKKRLRHPGLPSPPR